MYETKHKNCLVTEKCISFKKFILIINRYLRVEIGLQSLQVHPF